MLKQAWHILHSFALSLQKIGCTRHKCSSKLGIFCTHLHYLCKRQTALGINSQIHKFTNSQIHKFTNSQIHKFTNSPFHLFTISYLTKTPRFHLFTFSPFRPFTISYLTKTPRFHLFTFSPFHLFTISVLTKTPRFHFFTISRFHIINLPIRCCRPLSRPRWQSPHGGSSSGMDGVTFQPAALES